MAEFFKRHAQCDFTAEMLPHNRKEVFRDVMKWNFSKLLVLGLILLLAAAPIITITVSEDVIISDMSRGFDTMADEAKQEFMYQMYAIGNIAAIVKIPFIILFFVVLGGCVRVIRQYAFMKNVFFGSDFWRGIKDNGVQMLLLGLFASVMYAVSLITFNISLTSSNAIVAAVFTFPLVFSIFIGIPLVAYSTVSISIYDTSFIKIISSSLMVTAKSPGKTVGSLILCLLPFIPSFVPNVYFHIIGGAALALIMPAVMLYWYVMALDRFDEHINKDNYPHLVGIGTVNAYKESQQIT